MRIGQTVSIAVVAVLLSTTSLFGQMVPTLKSFGLSGNIKDQQTFVIVRNSAGKEIDRILIQTLGFDDKGRLISAKRSLTMDEYKISMALGDVQTAEGPIFEAISSTDILISYSGTKISSIHSSDGPSFVRYEQDKLVSVTDYRDRETKFDYYDDQTLVTSSSLDPNRPWETAKVYDTSLLLRNSRFKLAEPGGTVVANTTTRYDWDEHSQVVEVSSVDLKTGEESTEVNTYTYDSVGRPISKSRSDGVLETFQYGEHTVYSRFRFNSEIYRIDKVLDGLNNVRSATVSTPGRGSDVNLLFIYHLY